MSISTDYSYYNNIYNQQVQKKHRPSASTLIDSNDDKILNADEISNFAAEFNEKTGKSLDISSIMGKYDENGDGELDESEQEAMNQERALESLMANGMQNRQLRRMDGPPSAFTDADLDGDGSWNSEEFSQFIDMINEATGSSLELESALQKYDTDGDGLLSQSEQMQMMKDIEPAPAPRPPKAASGSTVASDEDYEQQIREKMDEVLELMKQMLVKRQEENALTNDAVSKAEDIKQAFMNRLTQVNFTYEKSFWFENTSESTQYGTPHAIAHDYDA